MSEPIPSPYLVPFDGSFRIGGAPTAPPSDVPDKSALRALLSERVAALDGLQRKLYAGRSRAVLLVFQGMDASGKDSTIRALLRGVNPQGCRVATFERPSIRELDHDFLWRVAYRVPERGRIGVFNRSHYEEVLIVRVHPEILEAQGLPETPPPDVLWRERFESIVGFERHLARNGYLILKLFLNVSREEQAARFRRRLDRPEKNWKFSEKDVEERRLWPEYMSAYEAALSATSRPWAPWYAIPADDKPYMRATVADIVVGAMEGLGLEYPTVDEERREALRSLGEEME